MTDQLVAFLKARLDEDAETARHAHRRSVGRWHSGSHPDYAEEYESSGKGVVDDNDETVVYDEGSPNQWQSEHIARHDPERVLAEVEAKRQIVSNLSKVIEEGETYKGPDYYEGVDACELTLKLLALPYAAHPSYDEAWRP